MQTDAPYGANYERVDAPYGANYERVNAPYGANYERVDVSRFAGKWTTAGFFKLVRSVLSWDLNDAFFEA